MLKLSLDEGVFLFAGLGNSWYVIFTERGTTIQRGELPEIQEFVIEDMGAIATMELPEQIEPTAPSKPAEHVTPQMQESLFSRWRSGRVGRWATRFALVGAIFGGGTLATAAPAYASAEVQVQGTDGDGVWLHDGPGLHSGLKLVMPEGADFTAECYNKSDPVGGNPVWLRARTTHQMATYPATLPMLLHPLNGSHTAT